MLEWLCQKEWKCGKCGKSVEYFPKKLWKSVGEWGMAQDVGHDRKAIIQQGRTMNPIGFTVRPCYVL